VRAIAAANLRRVILLRLAIGVGCLAVAIVIAVLLRSGVGFTLAAGFVAVGGVYCVASYRGWHARRLVIRSPGMQVQYDGWCRPPDGCNYALFRPDTASGPPFAVLRLPIRREMSAGAGWFFGAGDTKAGALVARDGRLLGAGRILDDGSSAWDRRGVAPPWYVMNPPDLNPPGG